MRPVPQERLDTILSLYSDPFRYLHSAETEFPQARGVFRVGATPYTTSPIHHLTTPQATFCIFQMNYVAFAEWVTEGRFPELDMNFEDYLAYMPEHMKLVKSATEVEFKKEISTAEPLDMIAELKRFRKHGHLWVAKLEYDINDGMASGTNTLTLKL